MVAIYPTTSASSDERDLNERLHATWSSKGGIWAYLTQVNHKAIAVRYIITAFVFFILAGVAALIMRVQLSQPELTIVSPELYNQLFTTHGTTMMFLFAIPVLEAMGMYFVPIMIGARDMAFPRLNAFGYWVYLISGVTVWVAMFTGNGPDAAWFNYVPLSGKDGSPGIGVDVWTTAITFMEIATLVAAVELLVTILKSRAAGMSLNRMPVFVWSMLIMSVMIIFAMPPVMLASVMLMLDRNVMTGFFDTSMGGDPLLWQHLFWVFGHPEVYIILLPGLGIVSTIVSAFAQRGNVAYTLLTASMVGIGFLSFGLWVHHMFATGLPWLSLNLFEVASMSIAIPSGIAIFSWIATLWGSRPTIASPLLYIFGFFFVFILGGITGVMVASIPFNLAVHDTYFVVAHFHYVLIGAAIFPLFGGLHFWFPKMAGKMLDEDLGKTSFWLVFLGFNIAFFPMHILGFMGMPRQVYTYREGLGWGTPNLISTTGGFLLGIGILVFFINVARSLRNGQDAPKNPWGGGTLEWSTPSPPPPYNFTHLPVVQDRFPVWAHTNVGPVDEAALAVLDEETFPQQPHRRETPGTRAVDASLERTSVVASPSIWPLLAAISVGVLVIGSMFNLWFVPAAAPFVFVSITGWLWPKKKEWPIGGTSDDTVSGHEPLPYLVSGSKGVGWWGIACLLLIEAAVFAGLIASYFYLFANADMWPPSDTSAPKMALPLVYTIVLVASALLASIGGKAIVNGDVKRMQLFRLAGCVALVAFLAMKIYEYANLDYLWDDSTYASIVWLIAGFHTAHVVTVLLKEIVIQALAAKGFFTQERRGAIEGATMYWIFVALMWIPLFATVYIFPNFV